ncbi:MAG: hypothetical protein HUU15_01380 [Candidatus Brocadiae bacterium]|nr:hypothetical protein [Candidatus Brocadiia bacterium]
MPASRRLLTAALAAAVLLPAVFSGADEPADGLPPVPEETVRAMEASRARVRRLLEARCAALAPGSPSEGRDTVQLRDGTELRGRVLDFGTCVGVLGADGTTILERPLVRSLKCSPAADRPEIQDLGVTFIERLPRLRSNHDNVEYENGLPRLRRPNPDPMWPRDGQDAAFVAHVRNHGTAPAAPFAFRWAIDGAPAGAGQGGALKPGESAEFRLEWPWKRGDHTVAFEIDAGRPDFSRANDRLEDRTDALGFLIVVERSTWEEFSRVPNMRGTFAFEDWVQAHFEVANVLFMDSIYPACPEGCLDRWRVDRIVVVDAGGTAFDPQAWDRSLSELRRDGKADGTWYEGVWQFTPWDDYTRRAAEFDWGFLHEMGHQVGLIDLYVLDRRVTVPLRDGSRRSVVHHYHDSADMMNGHGPHRFGEFQSAALNRTRGRHRGFYGDHLYDLPSRIRIRVLDAAGAPAPAVPVRVWQPVRERLDGPPVIEGQTDGSGFLELPNRPVPGTPHTTPDGFTLRANPFGLVDVVGGNAVLLVEIGPGSATEFHAIELPTLVVARWRGHGDLCTLDLHSSLAARGSLPPPDILACSQPAPHTVKIRWKMPASRDVSGFVVYAQEDLRADSDDPPREIVRLARGAPPEAQFTFRDAANDADRVPRRLRISVAALEAGGTAGTRSRPVCVLDTWLCGSLDSTADGTVAVADLHDQSGEIFIRKPQGWFLPVRVQPEGATGANFLGVPSDIAIDRRGDILACLPGQKKVARLSPHLQGLAAVAPPAGWEDPRGLAVDRNGNLYVLDAGTGTLAVFLPDGTFSASLPGLAGRLNDPVALACGEGALLYAVDAGAGTVLVLKPDRKTVQVTQTLKCPFERPAGAAVDGEGRVFVVFEKGGLAVFSSSGRIVKSDPAFPAARGIAIVRGQAILSGREQLIERPVAELLR